MSGRIIPVVKSARRSRQSRRERQARNSASSAAPSTGLVAGRAGRELDMLDRAAAELSKPPAHAPKPKRENVRMTPPPAAVNHATTPASAARGLSRRAKIGGGVAAGVGAAGTGGYLIHRRTKQRRELAGIGKSVTDPLEAAFRATRSGGQSPFAAQAMANRPKLLAQTPQWQLKERAAAREAQTKFRRAKAKQKPNPPTMGSGSRLQRPYGEVPRYN